MLKKKANAKKTTSRYNRFARTVAFALIAAAAVQILSASSVKLEEKRQ